MANTTLERKVSGPGKGKKGIYAEVPGELADAFREYAQARGEKLSAALARAMRREMASPPPIPNPPPDPPLPPTEPPKGRKKK